MAHWTPERADDPRGILLVVADGMGGARAGEVASHLAVDTVLAGYQAASGEEPGTELRDTLERANEVVYARSVEHPELRGMGTTCTACAVIDRHLVFAHVGDSRAYLVRDGDARQLTHDHSLVAQLVRTRQLTAEEARQDPRRNVVTRSVGVAPQVEVDAARVDGLEPGDTLLLCTDGLHGLVEDGELARLASGPDLDRACAALVELARARGGPDNITVVLARMVEP